MELFDRIGNFARAAGEKAGDTIEITKLNARIYKEREAIKNAMTEIGRVYYAKIDEGFELLPEAAEYCEAIKIAQANIDDAQASIDKIKGIGGSGPDVPGAYGMSSGNL